MGPFYIFVITVAVGIVALLRFLQGKQKNSTTGHGDSIFAAFKNNYVLVYSLMMAGDWLQGPYVYALYDHYGFSRGQIGKLFIAGFGASLVLGTVVGSLADRVGRRAMALAYVVIYALSCATKHSPNYNVLMVGRLLGGTATSILFSVFESWVVAEHRKRRFDDSLLGDVFSKAVFYGNGVVAIVSGVAASFLVETMDLGKVAPFDLAALVLFSGGGIIALSWPENYGDSVSGGGADDAVKEHGLSDGIASAGAHMRKAWDAIFSGDKKIAALGACQALYEGAMYCFVFLWTPVLEGPRGSVIPHGMIFACFMASSMVGSLRSEAILHGRNVVRTLRRVFLLAAACLAIPAILPHLLSYSDLEPGSGFWVKRLDLSMVGQLSLLSFLVYEVTVGIFWPTMMKLRAEVVPEEVRAAVINLFRVPVNLFVCFMLFKSGDLPVGWMLLLCSLMVLLAAGIVGVLEDGESGATRLPTTA